MRGSPVHDFMRGVSRYPLATGWIVACLIAFVVLVLAHGVVA